jgi:chromosome segregation ATPase
MKKPIDKLASLDTAIQQETATIKALETNLQRTQEEKEKAAAEQQQIAYSALAENDTRAQVQLQECEQTLPKFSARVQSCEAALATAKAKLDDLREQRQGVFVAMKKHQYAAECAALVNDDAAELEKALTEMGKARDALRLRLRKMETTAVEAGLDVSSVHSKLRTNLARCVTQRCAFDTVWLNREAREIFRGPVPTVVRSTLDGVLSSLEPEQEKKAS